MPMTANADAARRVYSMFNEGDLDGLADLVAEDVVDHEAPPGQPQGLAGLRGWLSTIRAAFPDLEFTVEDVISEGDRVVCRVTMRGTHEGELYGMAPTGRSVQVPAIDVLR